MGIFCFNLSTQRGIITLMNDIEVKFTMKDLSVLLTILGRECRDFEEVPRWYRAVFPVYKKILDAKDTLNLTEKLPTEKDFN